MNKAQEKVRAAKEKADQHITRELTKTRQILWRFSKVEKHVEKKRTTFSELFFDLAVVFIFSLLASKLMGSIGRSEAQTELNVLASKGSMGISNEMNHWVGALFWLSNFMALWFTWYQFSNYTKYHWRDNIGNNVLVLALIMTLVLQGSGIYFTNPFLSKYSLLMSFICARVIFCAAQFVAINYSHKTKLSEELMIKTRRQMVILSLTIIITIAYAICESQGILDDVVYQRGTEQIIDPWKSAAFISAILIFHMFSRFCWKLFGSKKISNTSYRIVFHTKERHHLFIIIAIGELIVVTLTSSFINKQTPTVDYETILYLFMTPFIGMSIWYVYKTVFYKATPTPSKGNYYLYITTHVFLVLGILVFLGSMKSHMLADAYLKNSQHMAFQIDGMADVSRTFYSLGIVIGFALIIIPMSIYALFIKFNQERWGQVVKGLGPILLIKATIIFGWFIAESVLFWLGINVHFSSVIYAVFAIEAFFAIVLVWRSQKVILSLFETVEEFDAYSAKLDQ